MFFKFSTFWEHFLCWLFYQGMLTSATEPTLHIAIDSGVHSQAPNHCPGLFGFTFAPSERQMLLRMQPLKKNLLWQHMAKEESKLPFRKLVTLYWSIHRSIPDKKTSKEPHSPLEFSLKTIVFEPPPPPPPLYLFITFMACPVSGFIA